jgi:hypothetical protein
VPVLTYDSGITYDSNASYDLGTTGLYFFTPTVQDEPPFLPDSTFTQIGLWRHYAPGIRGVTVFLLNDGTYVQDTATPGHDNVNVPYPINFNNPGAPIVQTTNWDGTVIDTFIDPYVVRQYFGGTYNGPLDDAEVISLIAAGYGANLVPLP